MVTPPSPWLSDDLLSNNPNDLDGPRGSENYYKMKHRGDYLLPPYYTEHQPESAGSEFFSFIVDLISEMV